MPLIKNVIEEGYFTMRKLPLVLDLDDTLVRMVGENDPRHVPERDLYKCR